MFSDKIRNSLLISACIQLSLWIFQWIPLKHIKKVNVETVTLEGFLGCCKCGVADTVISLTSCHCGKGAPPDTALSGVPFPCPWPPFGASLPSPVPPERTTAEKRVNIALVVLDSVFSRRIHTCVPYRHFMLLIYCFVQILLILIIDFVGDLRPISSWSGF